MGRNIRKITSRIRSAGGRATTRFCMIWTLAGLLGQDAPAAPPDNDTCANALAIPSSGPFPHWTPAVDITDATTAGDPTFPSCVSEFANPSFSTWYSFTPSITDTYMISTCSDAPTATTVEDTIVAIYTSVGGCQGPFVEIVGGCNDDFCGSTGWQSSLFTRLLADTTYFIVVWKWDNDPPPPSNSSLQLIVDRFFLPDNDTCEDAVPIGLNLPVLGTTVGAINHYELDDDSCYQDVLPTERNASGGDVVYRFTAPEDGLYNFKAYNFGFVGNLVLYLSDDCPSGPYPTTVANCLSAADRNQASTAEATVCVPLTSGQQVYVFVDEQYQTEGSSFTLEVTTCRQEMEPNDTALSPSPWRCGMTASIDPSRDVDYFSLGAPPPGSRIFALLDGEAASFPDFDMRVVTETNTLEFDDKDNDATFADSSPNIAGTPATGEPTFLQIQYNGSGIVGPYSLYSVVQPPLANAALESEPNDLLTEANAADVNYFRGTLSGDKPSQDSDVFRFTAEEGEVLYVSLDADPTRDTTPINARLDLLDEFGNILVSVNDASSLSSISEEPGNLFASSPFSPAESLVYRTIIAGTYFARVSIGTGSTGPSGGGDYLLSIAKNCVVGSLGINSRPNVLNLGTVSPVYSGLTAALTGMIEDADLGQTHLLEIDWGDGSDVETIQLLMGETEFVAQHDYPSLPPGGSSSEYTVRVIIRDNLGRASQSLYTLTVTPLDAARFVAWEQTSLNTLLLHLEGTPNAPYRIQAADSPKSTWSDLGSTMADEAGLMTFEDTTEPMPRSRFYRAIAP